MMDDQNDSNLDDPVVSEESGTSATQTEACQQSNMSASCSSPVNDTDSDESVTNKVDELQQKLGGYGRLQISIFLLLGLVYIRGCWNAFIPVLQGVVPSYHCNSSPGLSLNESVPSGDDGQCQQYVNLSLSNQTEYCTNGWNITWEEDGFNSIVSEYTLLCDREYLNELSTTVYMVGTTCSVLFLTPLTERIGTKIVMLACLWLQVIVGVALAYADSIIVYTTLKFFIGFFNMTVTLCLTVMMSETFDAAHRSIPTLAIQIFWAVGIMTLALLGYLIRDWKLLQLAISIPINVFSITFIWLIPQSLPWLLSKGKIDKAERVVKRFLKVNSLPDIPNLSDVMAKFDPRTHNQIILPVQPAEKDNNDYSTSNEISTKTGNYNNDYTTFNEISTKTDNYENDHSISNGVSTKTINYTVIDLFRHRRLRNYTCILCYLYLVNSVTYMFISYNSDNLDGDRYLNLFLLGLVEIPAYLLCILANRVIGRRLAIFVFLLLSSVVSLPLPFIPNEAASGVDLTSLKTALVIIAKFGTTGSYASLYVYASEVFPTVIRNQGVGFCSVFENIGSMAAPTILYVNKSMANLPMTIFGAMTVVGAVLTLFLPDTHNRPLPQTIADAESRDRKNEGKKRDISTRVTTKELPYHKRTSL